jgi:hypothetical protein
MTDRCTIQKSGLLLVEIGGQRPLLPLLPGPLIKFPIISIRRRSSSFERQTKGGTSISPAAVSACCYFRLSAACPITMTIHRVAPPRVNNWYQLRANISDFQSVDGDRIVTNDSWAGGVIIDYRVFWAIKRNEKKLLASYNTNDNSLALEGTFNSEEAQRVTQVPYHANMLPYYEYFAQGIQDYKNLEEFKILNFFLPPSWIATEVMPVLETIDERSHKGITVLQLSNCSLAADDITSVVNFLGVNETIRTFDISRSNIESVETAEALANVIKNHPALYDVNLAYCSLGGGDSGVLSQVSKF